MENLEQIERVCSQVSLIVMGTKFSTINTDERQLFFGIIERSKRNYHLHITGVQKKHLLI
jgi:histone acetyltransferase (RNA polymerase elongator complex component)